MQRAVCSLVLLFILLPARSASGEQDLGIVLFFATEENDKCVTQIHYIIQVINNGTEPAPAFDLNVVFDAEESPPVPALDQYKGISHSFEPGLMMGNVLQVELWWKEEGGVPPGDYKSWLLVDAANAVAETDETNNTDGPVYVSAGAITCDPANLLISSFSITDMGMATIEIMNNSAIEVALPFRVDYYAHRKYMPGYDDPGDQHVILEGLGAGQSHQWKLPAQLPTECGSYHSFAVVDGENNILETTEADNIGGPIDTMVEDGCEPCPDGLELESSCICGTQVVNDGYCCDAEPAKGECPEPQPETTVEPFPTDLTAGEDLVAEVTTVEIPAEVTTVEIPAEVTAAEIPAELTAAEITSSAEPVTSPSGSSGCSTGTAGTGTWPISLFLMLVAALWLRRACRANGPEVPK